jgi:hypothetical protein
MDGGKGERAEEKMIIEGAWILVIAVVTFAAIVTVVLLGSAKLYDPDRSHDEAGQAHALQSYVLLSRTASGGRLP